MANHDHRRIGLRPGSGRGRRDPGRPGTGPTTGGPAARHPDFSDPAGGVVSQPSSVAEALQGWPNPATVLAHADRALEGLQRAEEQVEELRALCSPASEDPADPGPVGSAGVLENLGRARQKILAWADTAAAAVQALSPPSSQ